MSRGNYFKVGSAAFFFFNGESELDTRRAYEAARDERERGPKRLSSNDPLSVWRDTPFNGPWKLVRIIGN